MSWPGGKATKSDLHKALQARIQRIQELESALREARVQIGYLGDKFEHTGSSANVLALIDSALKEATQ